MFSKGMEGNFQNFGFNYWLMILITILLIGVIITKKNRIKNFRYEKWIRYVIAVVITGGLISEQIWNIQKGTYHFGKALPLSLCSISALLSVWTVTKKSKFAFDTLFFTGIGGALLAIIHGDIKYDFPHITFIHFYEKHMLDVLVPIYMMAVHAFTPTIHSFKRMLIFLYSLLPFIIVLNIVTGGNYWFLMKQEEFERYFKLLSNAPLKIVGIVFVGSGYFYLILKIWLLLNKKITTSNRVEGREMENKY